VTHLSAISGPDNPTLRKPPNEKLRAWAWCVGIVSIFATGAVAIGTIAVIAVLNLGTIPGLIIMFVLFCIAFGTVIWLGNGKQRP